MNLIGDPRKLILLGSVAALLALLTLRFYGQQATSTQPSPEALTALARSLEEAVRGSNPSRVEQLTAQGVRNDYRWIAEWPRSALTEQTWHAGVIQWRDDGGSPTQYFIHVSRPQVTQSTTDHLYEVVSADAGPRLGREIREWELVGCRVIRHQLDVVFDTERRRVSIRDVATVVRQSSPYPFALYRLNAYYHVRRLLQDGSTVPYKRQGGFLMTPLPQAESVILTAEYQAELPPSGESYIGKNEAAVTAYWYLHTARLPVTARVRISAPAGWRSIAPGRLIQEECGEGSWSSVWENPIPVSFMMAVAGRYTVRTQTGGPVTVSCYLLHPSESRARSAIREASEAIEWFSQSFGTFPYPAYAVVESRTFPAGLEGYSFTLVGSSLIPGVIPHEVSHTWWGGVVPNTYTRSMWNEAFATYSESLFDRLGRGRHRDPGDGAFAAAAGIPDRPTLLEATDAMHPKHSAVGYQKGALVLGQLERLIGADRMLRSMREFVANHRRGEAAEWSDFVQVVERIAGDEAKAFLQPWLSQPGFPRYLLQDVRATLQDGSYRVTGVIVADAPVRPCKAAVRVQGAGVSRDVDVVIRNTQTVFRLNVPFTPVKASFDPDGLVPRNATPDAVIVR